MRRWMRVLLVGVLALLVSIDSASACRFLRNRCRPRCRTVACFRPRPTACHPAPSITHCPSAADACSPCGSPEEIITIGTPQCCVPADGSAHAEIAEPTTEGTVEPMIVPPAAVVEKPAPAMPPSAVEKPMPAPLTPVPVAPASAEQPVPAPQFKTAKEILEESAAKEAAEKAAAEKAAAERAAAEAKAQRAEDVLAEEEAAKPAAEEPAKPIEEPKPAVEEMPEEEPATEEPEPIEEEPAEEPAEETAEEPMEEEPAAEAPAPKKAAEEAPAEEEEENLFDETNDDAGENAEPAAEPAEESPAGEAVEDPADAPAEEKPEEPKAEDDPFAGILRAPNEPVRRWIDNTGLHETVGRLVEVHPDHIRILKANGRHATVPFTRLSHHDKDYVTATGARIAAEQRSQPAVHDTAGL